MWHHTQDGLLRYVRELLSSEVVAPDSVLALDAEVTSRTQDAVRFALDSPYPDPEGAYDGVYA